MEIKIENLRKQYGEKVALDIPSLDIRIGELVGEGVLSDSHHRQEPGPTGC